MSFGIREGLLAVDINVLLASTLASYRGRSLEREKPPEIKPKGVAPEETTNFDNIGTAAPAAARYQKKKGKKIPSMPVGAAVRIQKKRNAFSKGKPRGHIMARTASVGHR
jgi:hypothetical protein